MQWQSESETECESERVRATGQGENESRSCYTVAHGVGVQFLVKVLNESKLISKGSWHKPTKHKGSWQNTQKIKGNGRQSLGKLQQFVTWRKPTWSKQITKDEKLRFPFYYNHFFYPHLLLRPTPVQWRFSISFSSWLWLVFSGSWVLGLWVWGHFTHCQALWSVEI